MDRTVYIISNKYYDFGQEKLFQGGVETYLSNLIPLFREYGFTCRVYQIGKENAEKVLEACTVVSVRGGDGNGAAHSRALLVEIEKSFRNDRDILLFADHFMTVQSKAEQSLSIQHGIHWDKPQNPPRKTLKMIASGARFTYDEYNRVHAVKQMVCVDYNYLNWYRAQVDCVDQTFHIIPNFSRIAEPQERESGKIRIIFARRFEIYRGTRVFAQAVTRILEEYPEVEVTIAGSGPDEAFLKDAFAPWKDRTSFICYTADESLEIHLKHHIAVVPTTGSEGTSLSLLEAMSAQCAVICSNVGGMTNIVIDGYNGSMVDAGSSDALYDAVKDLLDHPEKRKALAEKGYETVKAGFRYEIWADRWRAVISRL